MDWGCKTGCVCRWQCQHAARRMTRHKESPRRDASEGRQVRSPRDWGCNIGRVEQETRLATIAANRAIISEGLVNWKCVNQERLNFLHAQSRQLTKPMKPSCTEPITTPQTTSVELTQKEAHEREKWSRRRSSASRPLAVPNRDRGSCTT